MPTAIWLARARDRGGLDRLDGEAVAFVSEREELVQAVAAIDKRPWAAAEALVGRWLAGHPVHSSWLDVGLGPQIEAARAEAKAAAWEALREEAREQTEFIVGDDPDHAAECIDVNCCLPSPRAIFGLALFARLMAIVSRPS